MERVFERLPRQEIFEKTGIQFLPFNTLFQLCAHVETGLPSPATRLLLIPDLINFLLTGRAGTEYTNATTTQFVNAHTGKWDQSILERLDLPLNLLTAILPGLDLAHHSVLSWQRAGTRERQGCRTGSSRYRQHFGPQTHYKTAGPTSLPAPGHWWGSREKMSNQRRRGASQFHERRWRVRYDPLS